MIKKIDHIGIAVPSIEEAAACYEKVLGLTCEGREEVESQKVRTAFFNVGGVHIELLEATSPESPIAKFLERNGGPGIHHLAFESDNIETQIDTAKNAGCRLINESPIDGAGGKKIAFLHPKSTFGVLTEICSSK
ncbi:MAG: methylmalonyl-CoA epimerase [SAR324 cluster bacterium]|uniref:Methylmalonyl-CoA epimerase n=1 Tax=SAR324 cluster bacterium TaxID=2024889 RepID=A0A7X9FQC5_9DELT|nr:methylmalonyl-CoA epimerase [SAR324 cluster bacterium]